jgi:hypothetical protein
VCEYAWCNRLSTHPTAHFTRRALVPKLTRIRTPEHYVELTMTGIKTSSCTVYDHHVASISRVILLFSANLQDKQQRRAFRKQQSIILAFYWINRMRL